MGDVAKMPLIRLGLIRCLLERLMRTSLNVVLRRRLMVPGAVRPYRRPLPLRLVGGVVNVIRGAKVRQVGLVRRRGDGSMSRLLRSLVRAWFVLWGMVSRGGEIASLRIIEPPAKVEAHHGTPAPAIEIVWLTRQRRGSQWC